MKFNKYINKALSIYNLRLVKLNTFLDLLSERKSLRQFKLGLALLEDNHINYFNNIPFSKSQLSQDLIALHVNEYKRNGFFVEFGATDGISLSNTYMLEKQFNWNGILAEPAKLWHSELHKNRSCAIETKCVWRESAAKVLFNEVVDMNHDGELSTIDEYSSRDKHADDRKAGKRYEVETISLLDMLEKHSAPLNIDYLSIDTEGSEYEILREMDFLKYRIRFISCEHNYTQDREKIYNLLISSGYTRVFEEFSLFDDWYVLADSHSHEWE